MVKLTTKLLLIVAVAFTAVGCATTSEKKMGNLTIRRYVEDRPRVDQELNGNSGYLYGQSQEQPQERKATRRLYYVEFSQENPDAKVNVEDKDYSLPDPQVNRPSEDRSAVEDTAAYAKSSKSKPAYYAYSAPADSVAYEAADNTMDVANQAVAASLPQDYKIQKDDTLQKISQKFYGSYSKWTKIYDANKETLKDPNHIVPGKTITIPAI